MTCSPYPDAVIGRNEHELGGFERLGHRQRHAVRIDAVGLALAVETERGHDGDDALVEQLLQELDVHPLYLAGEQVVHAVKDAQRVGDDGVGAGGAKVVGGKALEDLVRQAVGGSEGELERGFVSDPRTVEVGRSDALRLSQRADLRRCAVDQHDTYIQRAQHGNVHQQVGEVLVGDDRPVHADDERLLAESRDVLQDAPQVG